LGAPKENQRNELDIEKRIERKTSEKPKKNQATMKKSCGSEKKAGKERAK
jgi:hypothetical protein